MIVQSVNIGKRKTVDWGKKTVTTGIFKDPTDEIRLGETDVIGDDVIDRKYHGGVDKACYLYSADHYPFWKRKYPETVQDFGAMGENITIEGLDEKKLNVGDTYKIGEAVIQISEPRQPCFKLNIRLNDHSAIKDFIELGHCGAYCRVIKQGAVKAGDEMKLISKSESVSVHDLFQLIYKKKTDQDLLTTTLNDPIITQVVKDELQRVWNNSEEN